MSSTSKQCRCRKEALAIFTKLKLESKLSDHALASTMFDTGWGNARKFYKKKMVNDTYKNRYELLLGQVRSIRQKAHNANQNHIYTERMEARAAHIKAHEALNTNIKKAIEEKYGHDAFLDILGVAQRKTVIAGHAIQHAYGEIE